MRVGETYWTVIDPVWDKVSIYEGPDLFHVQFSHLSAPQKVLFASHWCQSEVRNGGLHQFFSNPTGVLAPEAVIGFREIGLPQCADILEEAMTFFGQPYPRDREIRTAALDALEASDPENWDPFEALDDRFFEAIENDGYDRAADEYAAKNTAA